MRRLLNCNQGAAPNFNAALTGTSFQKCDLGKFTSAVFGHRAESSGTLRNRTKTQMITVQTGTFPKFLGINNVVKIVYLSRYTNTFLLFLFYSIFIFALLVHSLVRFYFLEIYLFSCELLKQRLRQRLPFLDVRISFLPLSHQAFILWIT